MNRNISRFFKTLSSSSSNSATRNLTSSVLFIIHWSLSIRHQYSFFSSSRCGCLSKRNIVPLPALFLSFVYIARERSTDICVTREGTVLLVAFATRAISDLPGCQWKWPWCSLLGPVSRCIPIPPWREPLQDPLQLLLTFSPHNYPNRW